MIRTKVANQVILKDALHNTTSESGSSVEYGKAIIVGLVAGYEHGAYVRVCHWQSSKEHAERR